MEQTKILVVDDDREIVGAIAALLELEGYTVLRAYDGLEALDALHTHDVQLMILDVMMPRMDGLSATMQIRKEKNVPILLLSAKTEDADKIAGLAIGADDYITKPYNPMELVARVKAMLRRYLALGTLPLVSWLRLISEPSIKTITFSAKFRFPSFLPLTSRSPFNPPLSLDRETPAELVEEIRTTWPLNAPSAEPARETVVPPQNI